MTAHETGVLTVAYKLNVRIAEGSVVRYGRTLIVTYARVVAILHGRKTLCALM